MDNSRISLSIRALRDLDPQNFNRFSPAYQPLIRRFAAGYPQCFRQAFRGKSTAFPRVFHTSKEHDFSTFFAQRFRREIADAAEKKTGGKEANGANCGKPERQ